MTIFLKRDAKQISSVELNWSPELEGDTIQLSTWKVVSGLTIVMLSDSFTPSHTRVWLIGGAVGQVESLDNTVHTAGGKVLRKTVEVTIEPSPGVPASTIKHGD